ncbi:MAG: hypothetical protein WC182_07810 [Bacilli bacterium]
MEHMKGILSLFKEFHSYYSSQKCIFAIRDMTIGMNLENITLVHNSLKGIERDRNQDDVLILLNPHFCLLVLFDGVSSVSESINCIQSCKRFIQDNYSQFVGASGINLEGLIYAMHVDSLVAGEIGKTTCSALLLSKRLNHAYIVSVGDSRIYAFSNSYLEPLTIDDNLPGNSNILTKYIGWEELKPADVHQVEVNVNQNFLICSDGFYSLMEKDLKSYFRAFHFKRKGNIKNAITRLQMNKNRDDSTYIIIRDEGI